MAGLLDQIFLNLDIENLERNEVKAYLCYLKEIVPQVSSEEEKTKFLKYSVKLTHRLVDIDYATIIQVNKRIAEYHKKKETIRT
jgi:hypothetical protein